MRYEDTSGSVHGAAGNAEARDDADTLANGSNGPATGNVITGAGTTTGKAGADSPATGHVVAVHGAGGTDSSTNGASLHVDGRYGTLVMDEHGNYKYVADGHAPASFRDLFQYTLADGKGGQSVADLVISRGGEIKVSENAQQIVPGPDGVVTLPAGVDLSDVHVVGRNLVVNMPDGSQIVIVNGAVFVPQLVVGGVEVPSTNLAALLIDSEPRPAAGPPPSSGGDFADPVPPLDPGVPLGDLIPPTELGYIPPEFRQVNGIIDRHPDAGTASAQLDDDAQQGGNPGGVGDDPGGSTASGVLPGSGGDGNLHWALDASGTLPAGFTFSQQANGDLWVLQGAVHVLTISVNPDTGDYTVTQLRAITHPAGGDENNLSFVINYTVTDQDGDPAPGTLTINVDDDTPTVSVTAGSDANVNLTTHDHLTIGAGSEAVSTSANFGGVFGSTTSSPGADGAGAGTTDGYALSTTGGASGLFSHGVAINLYNVGGVIVGSTATSAPANLSDASIVFTVSTTNTGVVTLTQFQQIDHPAENPSGFPFEDQGISLADGAITLTRNVTVVDGDGDQVTGSASVQIGANLHFLDDGPTIGVADRGEPNLTVDETDLSANATASFAANFAANFGADGPAASGSITYALGINAGATGLVDVATGSAIVLVQNGGVVEGHVGNASGALAFTVSVDASGNVTLDQMRALAHPDATNPDDSVTLANDNLVTLTATAHDFDGDTASSTINIGTNLHFEDDGPSIQLSGSEPTLTVDETVLATNASGSVAGAFTSAFGADGAGTISYALGITGGNGTASGLTDVATGQSIVLVNNAGVIEGHVGNAAGALAFTVSIDGSGNVTLDQIRAVTHPNTANPDDSVTLGADNLITVTGTVTDKDGDSASAVLNIGQNLNFEDDGPNITLSGTEPNLTVDETVLATNATASFATAFAPVFGADGAGTVGYSLSITGGNGTASGLTDVATGQSIVLVNNAGVIEGHVGTAAGALAFTVSVDASGNVTLDQVRALTHPDATNLDDSVTLSADNLIVLNATVTDRDGDTATAGLNIGQNLNFEDDGPSISANGEQPSLTVDETNLAINASASFAGVFTPVFGADGPGTVTYALGITGGNGTASGLTDVATGQSIVLVNNAGVIEGHVGNAAGALAFTVSVDASGNVTLDQVRALTHPDATNPNDGVTLSADNLVTLTATITDKDGDQQSATANIGQNLNFLDDAPSVVASGTQPTLTVDETVLATNATASFASVFTPNFGADGPAASNSVTYALGITGGNGTASGLTDTATGSAIVLVNNAGVIEGHVGNAAGALAFTVSVDASGNVTLDQIRAVVHNISSDPDTSEPATLSADNLITLTATVTDKDGDQQSATANIGQNLQFLDDGPHANNDTDTTSNVTDTAVGNVISGVGTNEGPANADSPGADGFGSIINLVGFNGSTDSNPSGGFDVNGQYGTLHMDANGNYTYTRTGGPGGATDTFTYTYVDGDGDPASATLIITIADNTPVAGTVNVGLDDDALSGGNAGGIGDDPNSVNATGTLPGSGGDAPLTFGVLLTGAPAGFTYVSGGPGVVLVQQGGVTVLTVTVNSTTGAYSVVQNAPITHALGGDENNQSFTITYTVTDSDTDVANGSINISVDDDTPTVSANAAVQLDDDALAGGNAGGIGDDPNATNVSGTLAHSYGADGAGVIAYLTTGAPAGFSYALQGNGDLWVMQGANHVLTLTVNSSTGAYTVTQVAPIDHSAGGDENNVSFTISYNVTDHDGDTATGSITVNVDDDTPVVTLSGTNPSLTVDETNLAVNATASFAGMFTDSFGADGPAASGSVAYSLAITGGNGTASGLTDVATGQSIVLVNNAGVIEGHVGTAVGALAFTVSVDASGNVTLDQIRALTHPNASDPNDSVSLANDNLVTLTQTITDHDGDTASATANIGQNLVFKDDGPSIGTTGVEPNLTVDETNLATNATASFAANFTPLFGADGAGTVTYALSINAGSTGIVDTATNEAVVLVNNAGVIEGRTATTNQLVFTVSVNASGQVTLDQIRAIVHPDANDPNDAKTLSADNLVVLTGTVTDKDGDQQSATLNIGQNLIFQDDGPSIAATGVPPTLTVDESNLAVNATASFAANFTPVFGADGAGTVTYALGINAGATGLIDTASNEAVVLVNNAGVIEGRTSVTNALVFTVSVNASGDVTLDQIRAVVHSNTSDPNDSKSLSADNLVTLTATVTDKDGDHQAATLNIGQSLVFKDDGPTIATTGVEPTLTVDETNLATNATASFAANFTPLFGADGAGTVTYALGFNAGSTGLTDTATGESVVLVNNAGVIEGRTSVTNALVFTVSVNASGNVTLDQIRAVVHSNTSDPNDSKSLSADNLVTLTATVTDKDGDQQSATLNIGQNLVFKDDGPSIGTTGVEPNLTVDETNLATNATASFAANFTPLFGADGAGTVTYALSINAGSTGIVDTATNEAVVLVNNAGVIEGRTATTNQLVFTVSVNASGQVTLDQIRAIVHPDANDPNDAKTLSADNLVVLTGTVTDKDGDQQSATLNIGQNLIFQDDGPSAFNPQDATLTNAPGAPVNFALDPVANGGDNNILNNFGADGPGSVRFNASIDNTDSGMTSGGVKIWYILSADGQTLEGKTGVDAATAEASGTNIFTIHIDQATSQYSVDMNGTVDAFTTINFTDAQFDFIGGNKAWFGIVPNGQVSTPVDDNSHDVLITPTNNTSINTSGILGGVDTGQSVGASEGFRIDYVVDLTGSPPNNYTQGNASGEVFDSHWLTNNAFFVARQSTGSNIRVSAWDDPDGNNVVGDGTKDTIDSVTIKYNNGTTVFTATVTPTGVLQNVTLGGVTFGYKLDADGKSVLINNVQGASGANDTPSTTIAVHTASGYTSLQVDYVSGDEFKFAGFGAVVQSTDPVIFHLPVQIVDKDGDAVAATSTIDVTLNPSGPPVVLDLNHDGVVSFLGRDAGVHFDYGNGSVATAWAAPQDGMLVNDANHDGQVSGNELVLGGNGLTDLQGLAAYDSNHDGQLSAADASFANFAVWQDANSNGKVDAGELQSLTARGIASISLSSDGIGYSAAGGDVAVAGSGSYTRTDGSKGILADAAFATGAPATNSNAVLMGALAAAGLAADSAAAATTHASLAATTALTGVAAQHTQAFQPVALDAVGSHSAGDLMPSLNTGLSGAIAQSTSHASDQGLAHGLSLTGGFAQQGQAPSELVQAMQAPAHEGAAFATATTAATVMMPAAQQLAGVAGDVGGQHNQVIGQVLADALHGGGGQSSIDGMLSAIPSQGGHAFGLAVASGFGAGVPNGDSGGFGDFTAAQAGFTMEHMMIAHQVAALAHG